MWNVAPSGILSLWVAPGMALTSFIKSAKQSANSSSVSWMIWHCSCVTSGPIVTSFMILAMHSVL